MMKLILIAMVFLVAGCAGNDKKAPTDNTVTTRNIEGESLFKRNCASCHKPDRDFIGPGLKGSLERWGGDKKTMYDFVRNPSRSASENAYAKKLVKEWKTMMTAFDFLSDAEIDSVMNFCNYYVRPTISGEAVPDK